MAEVIVLGERPLTIDQIAAVALDECPVRIDDSAALTQRLERSRTHLAAALARGESIYGVTTGYGGSCSNRVHPENSRHLGANLIRYHGCGCGEPLGIPEVRATLLCRLISLLRGYSAVSRELLDQLAAFLNAGITPVIPSIGSVGASGDLTPLSYLAATLAGEREVFFNRERILASEALERAGLKPYRFKPKEPLAIINGTAVMTGIAAVTIHRSRRVINAAVMGSALSVHGMAGNRRHFRPEIFAAKPFPGQAQVAHRLFTTLAESSPVQFSAAPETLQDPYSLRCAPHVIGVVEDAFSWMVPWVETEANGVSDNPLLDPESGDVLTGGNFYGGHIAFAMDGLKAALASVADLCDRQIALLVDPRFSRGLPSCLTKVSADEESGLHHGFKAAQITASALTAEALRNTMPAASFSRSTESHNQDKVSLGTIAARDAGQAVYLVSRVVAILLLVGAQACELRGAMDARPAIEALVQSVRDRVPALLEDRPMDIDIELTAMAILDEGAPCEKP